jgi:hypothetical protein
MCWLPPRLVRLHWLSRGHLQDAAKPPGLRGQEDDRLRGEGGAGSKVAETIGIYEYEAS